MRDLRIGPEDARAACTTGASHSQLHNRVPLLQASWGGGGKGIRKAGSDEDVQLLYKQVCTCIHTMHAVITSYYQV